MTRISPRRFEKQIERIARAGWKTIGLSEVIACASGSRVAAPNELAITFDDGYRGLRDYAFPVLGRHGFRATCFVITDYAGRLNRWDVAYGGRRFAHLAWRDMRAWQGRGIEFASHTATHPRLTRCSSEQVRGELVRSRIAIERELGVSSRRGELSVRSVWREGRAARARGGVCGGIRHRASVERERDGDRARAGVSVGADDAGRGGAARAGARGGGDCESMRDRDDAASGAGEFLAWAHDRQQREHALATDQRLEHCSALEPSFSLCSLPRFHSTHGNAKNYGRLLALCVMVVCSVGVCRHATSTIAHVDSSADRQFAVLASWQLIGVLRLWMYAFEHSRASGSSGESTPSLSPASRTPLSSWRYRRVADGNDGLTSGRCALLLPTD